MPDPSPPAPERRWHFFLCDVIRRGGGAADCTCETFPAPSHAARFRFCDACDALERRDTPCPCKAKRPLSPERLARAMYEEGRANAGLRLEDWDKVPRHWREMWLERARAVLRHLEGE